VKFCLFFKFFLVRHKLSFFGQNCSLPFSLRSLDIPVMADHYSLYFFLFQMSRNGGRSYERMFFLFSDMVMYSKPKLLDNGHHHHSCCCVLPLHHCSVENMFGCSSSKKDSPVSPDDRGAMFRVSLLLLSHAGPQG
jgi:hypothetical protein